MQKVQSKYLFIKVYLLKLFSKVLCRIHFCELSFKTIPHMMNQNFIYSDVKLQYMIEEIST